MASLESSSPPSPELVVEKHVAYIKQLQEDTTETHYILTQHLRISGVYWGVAALYLLGRDDDVSKNAIFQDVVNCYHPDVGGFGSARHHDAHMLFTVSAIQILAMLDAFERFEEKFPGAFDKIASYISSLQRVEEPQLGSFAGDEFGETDTRFIYCAFNALSLIGRLDRINQDLAIQHILKCQNFDGAFGLRPGAESHAGQVFTCVAALSIAGKLSMIDQDYLAEWLSDRQLPCGGLNGRPEKMEDVCYSWWVLSSLSLVKKVHWIHHEKLIEFILKCQNLETGGFSDRPGNKVDVFHTLFGIAGLSLLKYPDLQEVDPAYCMPKSVIDRCIKGSDSS